ncbi:hypothetical protein PCANC_25081 [Puccinia coronata f. sp. avenae]|uniref:RNA-dependent RNA polymerase n=1 Tax=Puccinia coronata f. sp. avenae TaxID=200324 RepID=A0A2N5TI47_9BASI|nr:hypothetical protein PCANC_25081 [Puccinia coronata f. sp. avenae]PLW29876.1 hypothetical protein PCASD_16598 [Puccinia coronata f. sp. avenae]
MEISISNYQNQINEDETRFRLIELISNIAHHPPLHRLTDVPINFDLSLFDSNRNPLLKGKHRYPIRPQRQSTLSKSQIHGSWRLTFPTVEFGARFLQYVSQFSPQQFGFSYNVKFEQATTPLKGKGIKIKQPPPTLVQKLKETVFTSPLQERELEAERQKAADNRIHLASIEFGGLSGQDHLTPDTPFRSEYQLSFYNPLVAPGVIIDKERNAHKDPATVFVDQSSAEIVVRRVYQNSCEHLTIIPSKTVKRIETHASSVLLFTEYPPTFHTGPHFNTEDDMFSLAIMLSSQAVKTRQVGFDAAQRKVIAFASHVIKLNFLNEKQCKEFLSQRHRFRLPRVIHFDRGLERTAVYTDANLRQIHEINARLNLAVSFQLDSLLYSLLLNPLQIIQLGGLVKNMEPSVAERALIRLASDLTSAHLEEPQADWQHPVASFSSDQLVEKFNAALARVNSRSRNLFDRQERLDNAFKCRSVTITPTTLILEGPLPEESNSILRLYNYNSAFIRVAIRDEDGSNHHHDREVDGRAFLRSRYRPFLAEGLNVAGRRFMFLGYSSSALKCHQAWFVCPFFHEGKIVTAEVIRNRMGSFSNVNKIPARYMARIAQAFTTTQKAVTLLPSQLRKIPDVERNQSVFTDGVGTISASLARQVEQALLGSMMVLKRRNAMNSSCYQIRLGGYKGMLSIDPTLPGEIVNLRPSMNKFDGDSLTLDIASSFRRPLPAFLNRPLIKILEDLKIPSHIFLNAQQKTVQLIEHSRASFRQSAKLMEKAGLGFSCNFPKILKRFSSLMRTDKTDEASTTFIDDCLDLAIIECLRDLKYRARIPLEGSYTLVGVADEDRCLQPGQIYACVQEKGKPRKYLSGRIAISRSPSIHPGDVQVVQAIGRPPPGSERLNALVNCVVFSVLGNRSLPSCLGGGDLDGDLYSLITDSRMIPYDKNLCNPGSYPPVDMKRLPEPCTILDGVDFFLDYISSDLVGIIATRHLQIADQEYLGTLHPDCLKLAQLHSKAVDYPKTGMPVTIQDLPKVESAKPDFMCPEYMLNVHTKNNNERYYQSEKVLGQLFRAIPSERVEFFESGPSNGLLPQSIPGRRRRKQTQEVEKLDPNGDISRRLKTVLQARKMSDFPDPIWIEEFERLLEAFSQEFLKICQQNSLSKSKAKFGSSCLSEIEALVGVILSSSSDRRLKKETIVRLQDQTSELFDTLKHEIIGQVDDIYEDADEDDDDRTIDRFSLDELSLTHVPNQTLVARALAGWFVATRADQKLFGIHSFGLVCLQMLCSELRV